MVQKRRMAMKRILHVLEDVLQRMGIEIKYAKLYGKGGLCRVKGEWKCIINNNLSTEEKVSIIAEGMKMLSIEDIYLPPVVRELIEKGGKNGNIYSHDKTLS